MTDAELKQYVDVVIPNIEHELGQLDDELELLNLYNLYESVLIMVAPYDFVTYNKALEFEEDKNNPNKGFYHHRQNHIGMIFEALNDMEVHDKYDMLLISMSPRIGKALTMDSKLLTPDGWITMKDVEVGQSLIGHDGKATKVMGVYPQGEKDIYEVSFEDGTSVKTSLDHLWTVQTTYDRKVGKERTVTTGDMINDLYTEGGKRKKYSIDYVKPVEFNNTLTDDHLHPYVMGALLGDGSLKGNHTLTNIDEDILDRFKRLLPEGEILRSSNGGIQYRIQDETQKRNNMGYPLPCKSLSEIRKYGLDVGSDDKFIPKDYLYSSIDNRIELLRGLMDTDGSTSIGTNSYNEYTTISKQLADDLIELVRSLGGRATVSTKVGTYTKEGIKHECSLVYRIVFNMEINPFYTNRKAERFTPRTTRKFKFIESIELVGHEECQCIEVDDDKHLFVTDGYNLTHNTTSGIRFLSWIIGRHPENTQLATSYSDSITSSFYAGVMEIVTGERYLKIFPDVPLVSQNAKKQEIWMKVAKRYPSISFVSIAGSMVGRSEAGNYLYVDDLVSGIEESLSLVRMEKLWQLYTVNATQRKKDGAKEIHIATRWSVHDPITKLAIANEDNPRCKVINVPCFGEDGESQFDFFGGFSTKYYLDLQKGMDEMSFNALYMCEPIEREGLLYRKDEMQYYLELPPKEDLDTVVAVCDSKALGKDFVSSPIAYIYNDDMIYIEDVVYNNGLPELTVPAVANKWFHHNVVRGDVEMNAGGNFFATGIDDLIQKRGGNTSIRMFYTSQNKRTKIITYSDFIKKHFIFKDPSQYHPNSEYAQFMNGIFTWTQTGGNKNDDAPDSIAMLAQLIQDLQGVSVKFLSRTNLGL